MSVSESICVFFKSKQGCRFGDACRNRHDGKASTTSIATPLKTAASIVRANMTITPSSSRSTSSVAGKPLPIVAISSPSIIAIASSSTTTTTTAATSSTTTDNVIINERDVCRLFAMTGTCRFGVTCRYQHVQPINGAVRVPVPSIRRHHHTRDGHTSHRGSHQRNNTTGNGNGNKNGERRHGRPAEPRTNEFQPCQFLLAGHCKSGNDCRWSHQMPDGSPLLPSSLQRHMAPLLTIPDASFLRAISEHKKGSSLESIQKLVEFRPASSLTPSVDINCVDPNLDTALTIAVRAGDQELLSYLIKSRANVEKGDRNGATPLALAAERANIAALDALIDVPSDVNCVDYNGVTPLMISSRLGHDDILNRLLAAGASIFIRDKTGYSAMGHAAEAGRVPSLKRLLDYGASALVHHLDGGWFRQLYIAAQAGQLECVRLLVQYGTDCEYLEQNMQTVWSLVDRVPGLHLTLVTALTERRTMYTTLLTPLGFNSTILDCITSYYTKRLAATPSVAATATATSATSST